MKLLLLSLTLALLLNSAEKEMDIQESKLEWVATKKFGQHNGEVGILRGDFLIRGEVVVGGSVEVNMNDISILDIDDKEDQEKIIGELKHKDLFHVDKYPSVFFSIDSIVSKEIIGKLTIKKKTETVRIPLEVKGKNSAGKYFVKSGWYFIDREEWKLEFGNWIKNGVVDDAFKVRFNVVSR